MIYRNILYLSTLKFVNLFSLHCRITKIFMPKKLQLRERENGKECFLFQGLLPQLSCKMKWWTHSYRLINMGVNRGACILVSHAHLFKQTPDALRTDASLSYLLYSFVFALFPIFHVGTCLQ